MSIPLEQFELARQALQAQVDYSLVPLVDAIQKNYLCHPHDGGRQAFEWFLMEVS